MGESITERYHVRRREFLNEDPEYPAFVIAVVEDTRDISDDNEDGWKYGTIILDFGDCYRRVSFNFDMGDADARAHTLKKISLIAEVVNEVRDGIEKEVASRNSRPHVQDHTLGAVA